MSFRDLLAFGAQHWGWLVTVIPVALVLIACFFFLESKNSPSYDSDELKLESEKSFKKSNKPSNRIMMVAIILITTLLLYVIIVIGSFVEQFHQRGLQYDFDKWGQVGDFFGGMLNPVLAFASFIALLYTIRIQSSELDLTRHELEKSAKAQKESAETLQHQLNESRKQYLMGQYHELFVSLSSSIDECISNRNIGNADKFKSYKTLLLHAFEYPLQGSFKQSPPKLEARTTPYIYQSSLSYTGRLVERDTCQMLARLAHLMQEYATQFGSTAVYRDYIFRFTETVSFMHYAEVLDGRFGDFQIFNIDEFYESVGFCAVDMPKE